MEEYKRFLSISALIVISVLSIYVGCLRSYAIYFFEREAKHVIMLNEWTAIIVPIALSLMLIVSYLSAKRLKLMEEEIMSKKLSQSSQSTLNSYRRKPSKSSDLESIPGMSTSKSREDPIMNSISESSESNDDRDEKLSSEHHLIKDEARRQQRTFNEATLEELAKETERVNARETDVGTTETSSSFYRRRSQSLHSDEQSATRRQPSSNDDDNDGRRSATQSHSDIDNEAAGAIKQQHSVNARTSLSRKSSEISSDEIKMERRKSMIYKQIGKIDFLPFSLSNPLKDIKKPTLRTVRRDSLVDILLQLLGFHLPLWLSVVALHITLVEIFSMKFYYRYYYHHPGMKLLALIISIVIGIFHEIHWTWLVNDILAISSAYIIIARVQTVSYLAGLIFLLGMIAFDLFWMYGVDLFSTVTTDTRAPLMLMVPWWGQQGKRESLAALDVIVPGIFLSILLKFADMYDPHAFYPSFYAVAIGLIITFGIAVHRAKSTPAMVIPALLAIVVSLSSVERPMDLLRFEIKH